ncbi:hypothetical protein SD81_003680 [Tolypothrix campylonemoides VB511288]|nr:hypothetical protein SD81_003680 [Tolypothrix campylonemoides VB511288]
MEQLTYTSVAHSVVDHALRKNIDALKYLRKAHNFNKKGAVRVPKAGYRGDGAAVYRKGISAKKRKAIARSLHSTYLTKVTFIISKKIVVKK